jgi:hypothetical protein
MGACPPRRACPASIGLAETALQNRHRVLRCRFPGVLLAPVGLLRPPDLASGRARPGSSVGTSVRLKIGRSAVRPRPWPPPKAQARSALTCLFAGSGSSVVLTVVDRGAPRITAARRSLLHVCCTRPTFIARRTRMASVLAASVPYVLRQLLAGRLQHELDLVVSVEPDGPGLRDEVTAADHLLDHPLDRPRRPGPQPDQDQRPGRLS